MKKILTALVLCIFLLPLFADDYSLRIVNSDSLKIKDKVLTMSGSVKLAIERTDKKDSDRTLTCDKVLVDMDRQVIYASGNVFMTDNEGQVFKGDSLLLNWDTLDVLVFIGNSTTERVNAGGDEVTFYSSAETISYAGEENVVFFKKGTISTTEERYWSVDAGRIALLDSDLVFTNATIKIGYVPVMWVPFFFYPGTTIAFNPAIGLESEKGIFLNTTTEIYGKYPKIGTSSFGSTEDAEDAITASVFSFMKAKDDTETIRDGIIYRPLEKDEELSPLQNWAKKNSSYLAVFVDFFEKKGISIGFDTKNQLFDKKLKVSAVGDFALMPKQLRSKGLKGFRYYFDSDISFKLEDLDLSLKMPFMSDPAVAFDYLNRNTVFGLDSVFGNKQEFPSTYSSNKNSYTWDLKASYSFKFGKHTFKVSSIESEITYYWKNDKSKYQMQSAVLPSFNVSIDGTVLDINKDVLTESEAYVYQTKLGEEFANLLDSYESIQVPESDLPLKPFKGEELKGTEEKTSQTNLIKISYNVSEKFSNYYDEKYQFNRTSSVLNGSIKLSGTPSPKWFSYSETFNTTLSSTNRKNKDNTSDFSINSSFSMYSKELGLSYNFNVKLLNLKTTGKKTEKKPFKWTKEFVSSHSLSFSKKVGDFTFGLTQTIKPLDMVATPSVSFSKYGITSSFDIGLHLEKGQFFKKGNLNCKISYSGKPWVAGVNFSYNFEKKNSINLSQNASVVLENKNISFKENLVIKDKFKFDSLTLSADVKHPAVYLWKNRIGFEGGFNLAFVYDFQNPYSSSLKSTFTCSFGISKFLDLGFSITSSNHSFYKYHDYSFMKDLFNSLNIFNTKKLKQTAFAIENFKISFVHYMVDWNLYFDASAGVEIKNGKYVWNPKATVLIKWNAVPELKVQNNWSRIDKWEK